MARIKYYYDTETCKYERVKVSKTDIILNSLGFVTVSLILALGLVFIFYKYFESPKEMMMRKENEEMKLHYSILNNEMVNVKEMMSALQERDDNIYRIIFEAEPIPDNVRSAGTGGVLKYAKLLESDLEQEKLILSNYERMDKMKREMYIQTKSYDEIIQLAINKSDMLAAIPAIQPITNKGLTRLASGFGRRIHPIYKVKRMHWGLDFSAPRGTPVYATGDGIVKFAKRSFLNSGYGNQVEINHSFGYITKYAHMQELVVRKGQNVRRGQLIGYVGSSGGSTAPHVHYEIIKNGKKINPIQYIIQDVTDEDYQKLLELASRENQSLG
jgi:murein DD-endopeptidase MepM/ murein hydrolase activator NlpD